jgi:hypothetical protein
MKGPNHYEPPSQHSPEYCIWLSFSAYSAYSVVTPSPSCRIAFSVANTCIHDFHDNILVANTCIHDFHAQKNYQFTFLYFVSPRENPPISQQINASRFAK